MIALVDADIVCYRCAASAENDPDWVATSRAEDLVDSIISETDSSQYKLFFTGPNNFRYTIYPDYKANRVGKPVPKHLAFLKEFLTNKFGATVTDGYEADDALGMAQGPNTIIASIDKDLRQVPGLHYNFVNRLSESVSEISGLRNFYTQLLVGDSSDNIKGCRGIGKVKAAKLLSNTQTEQEMFDVARSAYNDDVSMLVNGQLLWVWRKMGDIWSPLKLMDSIKQEQEQE